MNMKFETFHGGWPALLTPTTAQGDVGLAALRAVTEYLIEKDVGGLYVGGSTGEGVFMSIPERREVTEAVVDQVSGRVPVIVHVGAVATRDAVVLAKHAGATGANGVASILPPFRRGLEAVYTHYAAIANAVPDLPFFPYLFGGEIDALSLMRELLERVPNVAGAKYTGPDMYELQALVDLRDGGWTIFSGMDQQCVFAAMFGAPANIGTTLNLMSGVYRELHSSYEAGDLARARDLQVAANRVTRVLQAFGMFGALFESMRLLGFDCGEPRLPHLPLPEDRRNALKAALEQADFFELADL
ncbi:MAG: dihydrodipicolinate synthase family protein [Anaerolineae bacterium]